MSPVLRLKRSSYATFQQRLPLWHCSKLFTTGAASQSHKVHVIQGPYMQAMTGRTRFGIYIDAVQRDSRENALHHLSTTSGESIENGLRVSAMG